MPGEYPLRIRARLAADFEDAGQPRQPDPVARVHEARAAHDGELVDEQCRVAVAPVCGDLLARGPGALVVELGDGEERIDVGVGALVGGLRAESGRDADEQRGADS